MARRCEAAGGERVEFSDYVTNMWASIGYSPEDVEIASLYDDHGDIGGENHINTSGGTFSPPKGQSLVSKFGGVVVKNFPKESDDESILASFLQNGLPRDVCQNIEVKENGKIYINNLDNKICQDLVKPEKTFDSNLTLQ